MECLDSVHCSAAHLPGLVDELAAATRDGNWNVVKAKAHDLKGVAGNYGYRELSAVAALIETHIADNTVHRIPHLAAELSALNERVQRGAAEM